jgi:arginase
LEARVSILRGRTSDRSDAGRAGAERLGAVLAERLGIGARSLGEPEEPRVARWEEDLRDSRATLATAAEAIAADDPPLLLASDCSIAVATLPAAVRRTPDAHVVWLDAHGDFNTPATSPSGYLCGMCLAAACGRWDAGYGPAVDPARVVLSDARDLDPAEREELENAGVRRVPPAGVAAAVRSRPVFLHLDCDILDPALLPAAFPAAGGLSFAALSALLADLAGQLVGAEVTSIAAEAAEPLADLLTPLLRTPPPAAAR